MSFTWKALPEELRAQVDELMPELESRFGSQDVNVFAKRMDKGLKVETDGRSAVIGYHKLSEFTRGLGILAEKLHHKDYSVITEEPVFENLTLMQDNSRNSVSNIESVKKLLRQMALMGYHSLQLYTEDTYEIQEYPFFGYMRGRYSKEELKELDGYAAKLGLELVPCIQTLAHLNAIFQWQSFQKVRDTGDILLSREEETYELIEAMIRTCAECFTSRSINIGMDEAEMLGRGKYLEKFSFEERFPIMTAHLSRVLEICQKYGFRPMMWSDMFFKMLSGGSYHATDMEISREVREAIPSQVSLIYWDYYSREKEKYQKMLKKHKELNDNIIFAGGAWRWNGYAPLMNHSILCGKLALPSCEENAVTQVIVTAWGDNGSECSNFVIGPVLIQYAEYCYRRTLSEEELAPRLFTCTGMNYQDFLLLDLPNLTPDNPSPGRVSVGPARYVLYQDLLMGLYDTHIDRETYPAHYRKCARLLDEASGRAGEYQYLFKTLSALSHALEIKCSLGILLQEAYQAGDREKMKECIEKSRELLKRLELFHECVRSQWYLENKPFGFEVLDIRLGGLKERVRRAYWTIEKYLDGELSVIEELEEKRLLLDDRENPPYHTLPLYHNNWSEMVSASVI